MSKKMGLFLVSPLKHHCANNAKKILVSVKTYNDTKYVINMVIQMERK